MLLYCNFAETKNNVVVSLSSTNQFIYNEVN